MEQAGNILKEGNVAVRINERGFSIITPQGASGQTCYPDEIQQEAHRSFAEEILNQSDAYELDWLDEQLNNHLPEVVEQGKQSQEHVH